MVRTDFTLMAQSRGVDVAVLQDEAVQTFINEVRQLQRNNDPVHYMQQPKLPVGQNFNIRLLPSILDDCIELAGQEVSVPNFIFTALMHWAEKHNFRLE